LAKKNKRKFDTTEIRLTDEELALRMEQRYKVRTAQLRRKKTVTLLVFLVAFAILATMCGKDIVRLKAENVALKRQQVALKKERDELKAELESTSEQEYIRDQARKQLRLLNPGELLFVWDE
jgi:cell division protein DivIC